MVTCFSTLCDVGKARLDVLLRQTMVENILGDTNFKAGRGSPYFANTVEDVRYVLFIVLPCIASFRLKAMLLCCCVVDKYIIV